MVAQKNRRTFCSHNDIDLFFAVCVYVCAHFVRANTVLFYSGEM